MNSRPTCRQYLNKEFKVKIVQKIEAKMPRNPDGPVVFSGSPYLIILTLVSYSSFFILIHNSLNLTIS